MSHCPVRVIKLGGSLLEWADWAKALQRWLADQPPAANVMIVGGGAVVEALRVLDRAHSLPSDTAHWLAIRGMGLTARIAVELLQEARLVCVLPDLELVNSGILQILDVERFLSADSGSTALPCTWNVTSDSIAARLASELRADELVLLKSALPPLPATTASARDHGYVDAHFSEVSRHLWVRCVNLRDPGLAEIALTTESIVS